MPSAGVVFTDASLHKAPYQHHLLSRMFDVKNIIDIPYLGQTL